MVKGAAPRPAVHLSRTGNMSVCLVFGHDGEAGVVASKIHGQEGIGRCQVANVRQPQGLDRSVLQGLEQTFRSPLGHVPKPAFDQPAAKRLFRNLNPSSRKHATARVGPKFR